jgi:hypothetical protein
MPWILLYSRVASNHASALSRRITNRLYCVFYYIYVERAATQGPAVEMEQPVPSWNVSFCIPPETNSDHSLALNPDVILIFYIIAWLLTTI